MMTGKRDGYIAARLDDDAVDVAEQSICRPYNPDIEYVGHLIQHR